MACPFCEDDPRCFWNQNVLSSYAYTCIRHYFPRWQGGKLTDRAGARHGNLTPPRISPSCPHCLCLWLGRSIIIRLLTESLRNSLPVLLYGRMETALHLIAVFYADTCTGGLGASSNVAAAPSQEPPASGRIPLPDIRLSGRPGKTPSLLIRIREGVYKKILGFEQNFQLGEDLLLAITKNLLRRTILSCKLCLGPPLPVALENIFPVSLGKSH